MEGFGVHSEQVQLNVGDTLVLYTDGVTESANAKGDLFGLDGLAGVVRENNPLAPEDLIQQILLGMRKFADRSPLLDDVTVVVGKAV
jgi:sigma-B regulation protein RsbU (phosphoserine phosphatase)